MESPCGASLRTRCFTYLKPLFRSCSTWRETAFGLKHCSLGEEMQYNQSHSAAPRWFWRCK